MTSTISKINPTEARGRVVLIAALVLIATFIFSGFIESWSKGETDLAGGIVGNGILLSILFLAFRGGQLAMKLTKGCTILFAGIVATLIIVILITVIQGNPLPEPPTPENTIPFFATLFGVSFCIWALFLSSDVKAFVAYQREAKFKRELRDIKRK